jgi:NTE family protein
MPPGDEEKSPLHRAARRPATTAYTFGMPMRMASCDGPQVEGQVVLVLQGGGALGAYQLGVYQALHEAGVEPDWVIGTSIGAVNGAIIAGNALEQRLPRLREFWDKVRLGPSVAPMAGPWASHWYANLATTVAGIPAFFMPRVIPWGGIYAALGVYAASWYRTEPLQETLSNLLDPELLNRNKPRLTVCAVGVRDGELRYFDSRSEPLGIAHVMASGALPPAFPAIRVEDAPFWDGGIYSNTPIERVLDDEPRHDSLIFTVNVWHPQGPEPGSIWQVLGRQKNIQYASRSESHIARQKQIHRLRHVVRRLARHLPPESRAHPEFHDLDSHGCGTTMHVVRLLAPQLDGDDYNKDIDFTPGGIGARSDAGYADTMRMLNAKPWLGALDPLEGVVIHQDMPMSRRLEES